MSNTISLFIISFINSVIKRYDEINKSYFHRIISFQLLVNLINRIFKIICRKGFIKVIPFLTWFNFILFTSMNVHGKYHQEDSVISAFIITSAISVQQPFMDMGNRYGTNMAVGGGLSYKINDNWIFGVIGNFLFGGNVKEDIMKRIKTSKQEIIDGNGQLSNIVLMERGMDFRLMTGKIFPISKENPNSGMILQASFAFLQHKIRIENQYNDIPQLSKEYKKGYDKLSNGAGFGISGGYLHLGSEKLINFMLVADIIYAITKSRRSFDFDLMRKDEKKMNDLLIGLKISLLIPIFPKTEDKLYYH